MSKRIKMNELKRQNAVLRECVSALVEHTQKLTWRVEDLERNVRNLGYGEEILSYKYLYLKTGKENYLAEARRLYNERADKNV